jgi:Low psii accumulation1 / Rep27
MLKCAPMLPRYRNKMWMAVVLWLQLADAFVSSFRPLTPSGMALFGQFDEMKSLSRFSPNRYNPICPPESMHLRSLVVVHSSSDNRNGEPEYSREIQLRVEAESPFRKIRFFIYTSLGLAAATSLVISTTRIIAGLNGINTDLMDESILNAGVDLGGIVVLAILYQRDAKAQESRLKRAAKGAELAKLKVRVAKSMMQDSAGDLASQETRFTTSVASLRRGRGMEKRVVIAVGSSERIQAIVKEAIGLQNSLAINDLLIVPVVITPPNGAIASLPDINVDSLPECIALPVSGTSEGSWKVVIDDELREATNQGIDAFQEGFCVILKKNGRVGQRTRGIYLSNMVGEVTQRRDAGMDVVNI